MHGGGMSALHGSATFRRFFIGGKPEKGFHGKAVKSINGRRFSPTTDSETVSFGWVPMTDPLADNVTQEDTFVGDLVCLGFRQDEKVVRSADVKDELKQRGREIQFERGKPLTRQERTALKEAIIAELRARAPVRRRVAELVWHPERAELRMFGASKAMAATAAELFQKTFSLEMEEVSVETLMGRLGWKAVRPVSDEKTERKAAAAGKKVIDDEATNAPF